MILKIHNTLSREKEEFNPLDPKNVRLYVCGPTVYDRAHIGNARPVVVFDVLYRILKRFYPTVTYVRNITDVDDKINKAAKDNKEDISELTARTTQAYHDDMRALNALAPDIEPRATAHIPEMITMIRSLIDKEYAYEAEGHVLFRVRKYKNYGALSCRSSDEMMAGARVEVAPYKEDAGDFVLWKPSDDETPGWESPWGRGRPGWHIECSAMSTKYLGEVFDIHGGGSDLIFPHHENEIAQSCCANDTKSFAKYWVHNGHLVVNGQKMSKSLGNFFTVQQLLENYSGEVIRLALLTSHYRQPLDWTDHLAGQSKSILDRFYTALRPYPQKAGEIDETVWEELCDDLNIPGALARMHEIVTLLNKTDEEAEKTKLATSLRASGQVLGLLYLEGDEWFQGGGHAAEGLSSEDIEKLIAERTQARKDRDFARSDEIRVTLASQGILLEDGSSGTTWKRG